jgi:hypothetical protein
MEYTMFIKPAACIFVQVSIFPQATKRKAEFECQLYWYSFEDQLLDQICLAFAGRAAEQVHHQFFARISKCTASAFSQVLLRGAATAWPFTWGDVQPQSQNIFTEKAQAIHNSTYEPLGPQSESSCTLHTLATADPAWQGYGRWGWGLPTTTGPGSHICHFG